MSDIWVIEPVDELAFQGSAGDYVRNIQNETEADPLGILVQILVMFGNLVGRTIRYMVGATEHYLNLYIIIVGTTALGRKGTGHDLALAPFRIANPVWYSTCRDSGASSAEGLVHRVRDPIFKPGSDEIVDEGVSDKRLMDVEKEFTAQLKFAAREGNALAEELLLAWETGDLGKMIKNRREHATGAYVSVIGHITPEGLQLHFSDEHISNGLGNRFMCFYTHAVRLLSSGGNESVIKRASAEFAESIRAALRQVGSDVRTMPWSNDAREIWDVSYMTTLNVEYPGVFGKLIARGAPQVARLSRIYAALDCSPVVEVPHILAALSVFDYSVRTVRIAFGDLIGIGDVDVILSVLREQPDGVSRKAISDAFSRNIPSSRIQSALMLIQKQGLATFEKIKTGATRPTEVWKAVAQPPAPTPDYLGPFKSKAWQKKLDEANTRMVVLRASARVITNEVSVNGKPVS